MTNENNENKAKKVKQFFSGIKKSIGTTAKTVKESFEERKAKRELERNIQNAFESKKSCQKFFCFLNGGNNKVIKVIMDADYDKSTFTLYGENAKIHKDCYFVDRAKQVFKIKLIQLNREISIVYNGTEYLRMATIFNVEVENSIAKQEEIKTIINNTHISVIDSKIVKSDLGGSTNDD